MIDKNNGKRSKFICLCSIEEPMKDNSMLNLNCLLNSLGTLTVVMEEPVLGVTEMKVMENLSTCFRTKMTELVMLLMIVTTS